MGFFSKKKPVSKEPIATWTPANVKAWLKSMGIPKPYYSLMKPIDGKQLVRMELRDLAVLFNTPEDDPVITKIVGGVQQLDPADEPSDGDSENLSGSDDAAEPDVVSATLSKLKVEGEQLHQVPSGLSGVSSGIGRQRSGSRSEMLPRPRSGKSARLPTSVSAGTLPKALSTGASEPSLDPPDLYGEAAAMEQASEQASLEPSDQTPLHSKTLVSPLAMPYGYKAEWTPGIPKDLKEHSEFLNQFVRRDCQEQIADFLKPLERTKGLVDLCTAVSGAGALFEAVLDAYTACFDALCVQANASHFQDFCVEVITLLEAAGRRGANVASLLCEDLVECFNDAEALMVMFTQHGWLLHLAFMDSIKERFDSVQDRIVVKLQAAGLATFANGKQLPKGDYKDPARAVRRVLKQIGKGSIADGIYATTGHPEHQIALCRTLDLSRPTLTEELAHVPSAEQGVGLANLYNNLVAGKVALTRQSDDIEQHTAIFAWYDSGNKGRMDAADLKRMLTDLGMLEGVRDRDQFTMSQLTMADKDQDQALSLEEFSSYYASLVLSGERHQLRSKLGISAEEELKHQFIAFANYGFHNEVVTEMDGAHFAKYCNDCKLIDKKVTRIEVDLIFTRVKAKGARRINFDRFLRALGLVAEKKDKALADIVAHCLTLEGPNTTGTVASNVRLHDDKSTYTGVYARGGPTNVDNKDLSTITDRSAADARGVKLEQGPRVSRASDFSSRSGGMRLSSPQLSMRGDSNVGDRTSRTSVGSAASEWLSQTAVWDKLNSTQRAFVIFSLFGKGQFDAGSFKLSQIRMDSKAFAKLCKEAGIMDSKLTLTRVDLIFTKCSDNKTKRLSYKQFMSALAEIGEYKRVGVELILAAIEQCAGPQVHATVPENVRWHDDKTTYTGVYAQGGPTNVDKKMSLEGMVDRQAAEHADKRVSLSRNGHAFQ